MPANSPHPLRPDALNYNTGTLTNGAQPRPFVSEGREEVSRYRGMFSVSARETGAGGRLEETGEGRGGTLRMLFLITKGFENILCKFFGPYNLIPQEQIEVCQGELLPALLQQD